MGYNDDVQVSIQAASSVAVTLINRILITTGEADIDDGAGGFLKLSGESAKAELQAYLTAGTKTAPLALQAVELSVGQVDSSGNSLVPDYIYVAGKAITDYGTATDISDLTDFIEANTDVQDDWWMLVPVEYNLKYNEWAVTYGNSNRRAACLEINDKTYVPGTTEQGLRTIAIHNEQDGDRADQNFNAAWAGRSLTASTLTAWKDRTLSGCEAYTKLELTNAEVSTLEGNGINSYLYKWGAGATSGSICTDKTTHIDSMLIRDTIVYNMAKNLYAYLRGTEYPSIEDLGTLKSVMEQVLAEFVTLDYIPIIDGIPQYSVTVDTPTSTERSTRIKNSSFEFLPNRATEKIVVTGYELLEAIGADA